MKQKIKFELYEGVEVPVSALLTRQQGNRYGSVQGLDDEELIAPAEVERLFLKEAFAPILALPVKSKSSGIRPNIDEDGRVEWGAFGTVDFDRYTGRLDKVRYKADRLKEQLYDERLMIEITSGHIKPIARYKIIKYVLKGILDVDEIVDVEMYCLAKRFLRVRRLQRELAELKERSGQRRKKQAEKIFESLD